VFSRAPVKIEEGMGSGTSAREELPMLNTEVPAAAASPVLMKSRRDEELCLLS